MRESVKDNEIGMDVNREGGEKKLERIFGMKFLCAKAHKERENKRKLIIIFLRLRVSGWNSQRKSEKKKKKRKWKGRKREESLKKLIYFKTLWDDDEIISRKGWINKRGDNEKISEGWEGM